MAEPFAVLFVAASPSGSAARGFARELRSIREAIALGRRRDHITVDIRVAATVHDLRRALLDRLYDLVHISGPSERGGLIFEDERGEPVEIPYTALAALLGRYAPPSGRLRCVILNAHWSITTDAPAAMHVPVTIVMQGPLCDQGALEFSRGFYDALAAGHDFAKAYEEGRLCVELAASGVAFKSLLLDSRTAAELATTPLGPTQAPALPPAVRFLAGRRDELAELRRRVVDDVCRVAVLGPAGIGKSTLARAVLHDAEVVAAFGERRYFVSLAAARDVDAMVACVAAALGVEIGADLRASVAARVGEQRTLLVLDNFETAWHAAELEVEALLAEWSAVARLALVVTVRGTDWPAAALDAKLEVGPLALADARSIMLRYEPQYAEAGEQLDELLAELGGIPLAIELLARSAQRMQFATLQRAWDLQRSELIPNWERALRMSFDSPRCSAEARLLLGALADLPSGVAGDDYDSIFGDEWPRVLSPVLGLALAQEHEGRLRMHPLVREYVQRNYPATAQARRRSMQFYLGLALEFGPKIGHAGGREAAMRLASELANIEHMILAGLNEAEPSAAIDASVGLYYFGQQVGGAVVHLLEASERRAAEVGNTPRQAVCIQRQGEHALHHQQLARAQALYERAQLLYVLADDTHGQAVSLKSMAEIAFERNEFGWAQELYERALPLYDVVGDLQGRAHCLTGLGQLALRHSDYPWARAQFEHAEPIYAKEGDVTGQARCSLLLAELAVHSNEYHRARELHEQARSLFEVAGDQRGLAQSMVSMAKLARLIDEHERARQLLEDALDLYEDLDSRLGRANCTWLLGQLALERSEHERARELYGRAGELFDGTDNVLGQASCIQALGDIAKREHELDAAQLHYERALPLFQRCHELVGQASCTRSLGDIALMRGQYARAREYFQQARAWFEVTQSAIDQAICVRSLGDIALMCSNLDEAREHYEQAQPLYVTAESRSGQAVCVMRQGEVAMYAGDLDRARPLLEQARALGEELGDVQNQLNCTIRLADIALLRAEYAYARAGYQRARAMCDAIGHVKGQADCLRNLGQIAFAEGDQPEARRLFEQALALFRTIPDPHSIGLTLVTMTNVAANANERAGFLIEARQTWLAIGRQDLVARYILG
jgi:tetratricopeptide (TPR) repeat protein